MTGPSDDGREDGAGSVISGETGFAHAGTVVDNQRGNIIVAHLDLVFVLTKVGEKELNLISFERQFCV